MRGVLAPVYGFIGAVAFIAAWFADLGADATLVVALVCGIAAGLNQLAVRDLLSRCQQLVDRGAERYPTDGGELRDQAVNLRTRAERIAIASVMFGALAPTMAAMRALIDQVLWSALALTFAALAITTALLLFITSRHLVGVMDKQRLDQVIAGRQKAVTIVGEQPKLPADDPNLFGYQFGGVAERAQAKHEVS